MRTFNYVDIETDILCDVSNTELSNIIGSNQVFDVCLKHYTIATYELLKELKSKFLFATILNENIKSYPSVYLFFGKKINSDCYNGIQLKCRSNFPIYLNDRVEVPEIYLKRHLKTQEIYLTEDFNEIIKLLNINDYDYYNKLLIKE